MAKYTGAGAAGAASSTAATAGIVKLEQGATVVGLRLYEWELAPAANAEDSNYGLRLKRQTTAGTWTTLTPAAIDPLNARASSAVSATASTVAGTAVTNSTLLQVGCNQRAGYRWVAVPGAELVVAGTTAYGIILEYSFAQGTAVNTGSMSWDE